MYRNANSPNVFLDVITVDQLSNKKFLFNNKKTSIDFYKETVGGKVVFICIGMEMLEKIFVRNVITSTHKWFDECPPIVHSDDSANKNKADEDIEVNWIHPIMSIKLPEWQLESHFQLINLEGRKIVDLIFSKHTKSTELSIPNFQSGIYFYLISNKDKRKFYWGKCMLIN